MRTFNYNYFCPCCSAVTPHTEVNVVGNRLQETPLPCDGCAKELAKIEELTDEDLEQII